MLLYIFGQLIRLTDVKETSKYKLSINHWFLMFNLNAESFGQLVLLGYDIAAFTPVAYQRRSLQRPLCGYLILKSASYLDAFSTYP